QGVCRIRNLSDILPHSSDDGYAPDTPSNPFLVMPRHRIEITEAHKRRLEAFAAQQGVSVSTVVRALIEQVPAVEPDKPKPPAEKRTGRITVRLTPTERTQAEQRARAVGMVGPSAWLRALARSHLSK